MDGERYDAVARREPGRLALGALLPGGHQPRAALAPPRSTARGGGREATGTWSSSTRRTTSRARRPSPPPRRSRRERWGLLLLTATPMQLDPAEYHALLTLHRPGDRARRRGVRGAAAAAGGAVADGARPARGRRRRGRGGGHRARRSASRTTRSWPALREPRGAARPPRRDLQPVRPRWSATAARVVGGFSARRLHRHAVEPPDDELDAARAVLAGGARQARSGARRWPGCCAGSSPLRPRSSRRRCGSPALERRRLSCPTRDAKYQALRALLDDIWDGGAGRQGARLHRGARHAGEPPRAALGAMASRRSGTTAISRWWSATARWPASAIRRGRSVLALHRGRRRGPQLPVRPPPGELRPAVEPGHDGAAHRPPRPHRPDAAGGHPRVRRPGHARLRRARAAGRRGGRVRRDGGRPRRGARGGRAAHRSSSRWPARRSAREYAQRARSARRRGPRAQVQPGVRPAARRAQLRSRRGAGAGRPGAAPDRPRGRTRRTRSRTGCGPSPATWTSGSRRRSPSWRAGWASAWTPTSRWTPSSAPSTSATR